MEAANVVLKNPVQIICIVLDGCSREFGQGGCLAKSLPTQANAEPCYNTYSTCINKFKTYQDASGNPIDGSCIRQGDVQLTGFACTETKYYFSTCEIPKEIELQLDRDGVYLGPVIKKVTYKSGTSSRAQPIATRGKLEVEIYDFEHNDIDIDPYFKDRKTFQINSANVKGNGSFFGRFAARNKFIEGRQITLLEGDCSYSELSQYEESEFILETFTGITDSNSKSVKIKGLDYFDLGDSKSDAKCPEPTIDWNGQPLSLTQDIDEGFNNQVLPTGPISFYENSEYLKHSVFTGKIGPDYQVYLCVGDEIIKTKMTFEFEPRFCPSYFSDDDDGLSVIFNVIERGALGTEISEHEAGDVLNIALHFTAGTSVDEVLSTMLNACTPEISDVCCEVIRDQYTNVTTLLGGFPQDRCTSIYRIFCDVVICEPTKLRTLFQEIATQYSYRIYYSQAEKKVVFGPRKPPDACELPHIECCDYESKTFRLSTLNTEKINQIIYFYDTKDPIDGIKDGNFNSAYAVVDTDLADCNAMGQTLSKTVKSRWHCDDSKFLMACAADRELKYLACNHYSIEFIMDKQLANQKLGVLDSGLYFTIEVDDLQSLEGMQSNRIFEITSFESLGNGCVRIKAETNEFTTDQCWLTTLCGDGGECDIEADANNAGVPILIEGNRYHCACQIY